MKKMLLSFLLMLGAVSATQAQLLQDKKSFSKQDSLRGSITEERAWWDLTYYDLKVQVFPEDQFISGSNTMSYEVIQPHSVLQIDLQNPMKITKVVQNGTSLEVRHDGNAHFIQLQEEQQVGSKKDLTIYFEGQPRAAKNAPWDGGFSWKKDQNGNHFIATSNQGLGASVWWPCKDHMYQEVEGMKISVRVPAEYMSVANGRLINTISHPDNTNTYVWEVKNPINNYGVNINIGKYVHFSEVYQGEKGDLDMDYYLLDYNLEKAKDHFKDAPKMMKAFEHWFGPYPFYEDSFKLVEVPYLGMEHQSSVTYGNQYRKGYLGNDLSGTGWGLKFDFIIIHEAGHEWFANNITNKDIADMWIHEGFTAYSESLFLEYYYGKQAGAEYVIGTRRGIRNDRPIIGVYDVNHEGSSDMYYKGANMLHTIRQLVKDDQKWREALRGMNRTFYHQTVTTAQIEHYLSKQLNLPLESIFDQYLRGTKIPKLELAINDGLLQYHWSNVVEGFQMPVLLNINGTEKWITPSLDAQSITLPSKDASVSVAKDFYIQTNWDTTN